MSEDAEKLGTLLSCRKDLVIQRLEEEHFEGKVPDPPDWWLALGTCTPILIKKNKKKSKNHQTETSE